MSKMYAHDFATNESHLSEMQGNSLMMTATGTFGGGTLSVEVWSDARSAYHSVAAFTAATTSAQEVLIGAGQRIRFVLSGATTPTVALDYWYV